MNKLVAFILILILTPLIGSIYGILHDQLTYTLAPEYYTKFKFYQFGLMDIGNEALFPNPRIQVSFVGFMSTWWTGIPIGIILGLFGLVHQNGKEMLRITLRALLITLGVALITGLIGLVYGKLHLAQVGVNWWLPENLFDKKSFIMVGSMHNFSYLGGAIGMFTGVIYSLYMRRRMKQ